MTDRCPERWRYLVSTDLLAIERHVRLMMVAHAYLELWRQEAIALVSDPDAHVTLGDL